MTNPDPAPIVAAYRAELESIVQTLYVVENRLEAMIARFDDEIAPLTLGHDGALPDRLLFASPVTNKLGDVFGGDWFIATNYAQRYENRPGVFSFHTGIDLNRPGFKDSGSPVYAAADGEIVVSMSVVGWQGLMVVIEHTLEDGRKMWSRYAHLKNTLGLGAVKRGDVIGYIGDYEPRNDPRGDHLHYDLSWRDLGQHPYDWPGDSKARVLTDYIDPAKWHTERGA